MHLSMRPVKLKIRVLLLVETSGPDGSYGGMLMAQCFLEGATVQAQDSLESCPSRRVQERRLSTNVTDSISSEVDTKSKCTNESWLTFVGGRRSAIDPTRFKGMSNSRVLTTTL